ncbi:hypothetical protein DNL40_02485 [Xylanimonas oleitrophica]|uniref:Uncharacterized protein n=1 Tax=Xylanimonas oleitrophica TaxID=2607479 RepID=A0A2W5XX38_9MICO|nr:hypothetical protein [Xylanimonas oleitrophica]PZR55258.1 hypothetical protein DNL40_02485 [Xylanimonas oleitrophica]
MAEPHVMTLDELETMMVRVVASIDADDPQAAVAALKFDPCRTNVGMTMRALALSAGVILRNATNARFGAGATFARPSFDQDAPEHAYWAGRMFAVAINDDRDTLDALVEACLDRVDELPEPDGAAMGSSVVFALVQALAAALIQLRAEQAGGDR